MTPSNYEEVNMAVEGRRVGIDDDVATHLGVAKNSVYRWIEERKLPAHRVGRLIRFKLSEIDDWVNQNNRQDKTSNSVQDKPSSKSHKKNNSEENFTGKEQK